MNAANPPPDKGPGDSTCGRLGNETASERLAQAIAAALVPGVRIHFRGELGTGKTHIVRAILRALGHGGRVRSPTFTLLEPYNLPKFDLYHFDLYRFSSEEEWLDAGFDEYLDGRGVMLVEWPEMAGSRLPVPDLDITLAIDAEDPAARRVRLRAHTPWGRECLSAIRDAACFDSG